jgi:hypothetical protein
MIICPRCKHPIEQHDEFFCSHTNCFCNLSRDTVEARYWAMVYYQKYLEVLNQREEQDVSKN